MRLRHAVRLHIIEQIERRMRSLAHSPQYADNTVRAGVHELETCTPRLPGARVRQVDDRAAISSFDGAVRRIEKALQTLRSPVIAARLLALRVHSLLNDAPLALCAQYECVQI